jgi:two-component system chemotaxis response regulator CheB
MEIHKGAEEFPLVCVGGGAADIDGYINLLGPLPVDLGLGFVLINHLGIVVNLLLEVLPHCTEMPVAMITNGMPVQPDHVYINPEERDLHILNAAFELKYTSKPTGWPDVITVFLRSVSANWRGQIIAIILSGYDGDGSPALGGVKDVGGITIAQQADTARQPDMPLSAIASGHVDLILSIDNIAREVHRIARRLRLDGKFPKTGTR